MRADLPARYSQLSVVLDPQVGRQLHRLATEQCVSRSTLVRALISKHIEEHRQEEAQR